MATPEKTSKEGVQAHQPRRKRSLKYYITIQGPNFVSSITRSLRRSPSLSRKVFQRTKPEIIPVCATSIQVDLEPISEKRVSQVCVNVWVHMLRGLRGHSETL